ncbi:MAG TPA: ribulokinase [Thermoguttaceae bacterium]|nr:ribulokinase [Thermoguttaceae bacterium]
MAKASEKQFSLGVDYGTNSVRALIVDVADGSEVGTAVYNYPSGENGILLDPRDPNLARQNPADYIEGFFRSVAGAIKDASKVRGFSVDRIVGIGVDTTASTPLPVDCHGTPLAMLPEFKKDLAAYAWLWKDHTSHAEALEITAKAAKAKEGYLDKCGGAYSSEWFWSKILHCIRTSPKVARAAYSWVEQCDFISGCITGNTDPDTMPRGICAAGHKGLYHEDWGGLPSKRLLSSLSPELAKLRDHYAALAVTCDQPAGVIDPMVAKKVGLPQGIPVAVGGIDAHLGAVGAGIKPGTLVKIIGTSTCDMLVVPGREKAPEVPGLCGIVPGSIVPGMYGIEAGQSAVGDIFNWFVSYLTPAAFTAQGDAHVNLTQAAAKLKAGQSGLLALDWNNGNRSVLTDPLLTGLLVGQTLHTTAPEVYRALVEATAFGALAIINRYRDCGASVKEVVNCGGIAEKNAFVMQIYADVCNVPMKISRSAQTCALGAAIFGAVVGGAYRSTEAAQKKMTGVKATVYRPDKQAAKVYAELFKLYTQLHDAFGMPSCSAKLGNVMKDLIAIRNRQRK